MKDYYKILRVHPSASGEDIQDIYRRFAHKYHPDKGGDEARFKEVNEAYQVLSDPKKRKEYDDIFYGQNQTKDQRNNLNADEKRKFAKSVIYLIVVGIFFWIMGDQPGGDYNVFLVLIGWAFIIWGAVKYFRG